MCGNEETVFSKNSLAFARFLRRIGALRLKRVLKVFLIPLSYA